MEHNNEGLQDDFPFQLGEFELPAVHFPGEVVVSISNFLANRPKGRLIKLPGIPSLGILPVRIEARRSVPGIVGYGSCFVGWVGTSGFVSGRETF